MAYKNQNSILNLIIIIINYTEIKTFGLREDRVGGVKESFEFL